MENHVLKEKKMEEIVDNLNQSIIRVENTIIEYEDEIATLEITNRKHKSQTIIKIINRKKKMLNSYREIREKQITFKNEIFTDTFYLS